MKPRNRSSYSQRRRTFRQRSMEAVESRMMMAGNVLVSVVSSAQTMANLQVTGDTLSNSVEIAEISPGTFRVWGTGGTTVNGSSARQDFRNVTGVNVKMAGGDDVVALSGSFEPDTASSPPRLPLDLGTGNDVVRLTNVTNSRSPASGGGAVSGVFVPGHNSISTGSGNDRIDLERVVWHGNNWAIDAGTGDDQLTIRDSVFDVDPGQVHTTNPLSAAVTANMGLGNDRVAVEDSNLEGFALDLGPNDDKATVVRCNLGEGVGGDLSNAPKLLVDGNSGYDTLIENGNNRVIPRRGIEPNGSSDDGGDVGGNDDEAGDGGGNPGGAQAGGAPRQLVEVLPSGVVKITNPYYGGSRIDVDVVTEAGIRYMQVHCVSTYYGNTSKFEFCRFLGVN